MANSTRTKKTEVESSIEKKEVIGAAPKKTPRKFAMDDPILVSL